MKKFPLLIQKIILFIPFIGGVLLLLHISLESKNIQIYNNDMLNKIFIDSKFNIIAIMYVSLCVAIPVPLLLTLTK
jgi:hypothetical protein